MKLHCETSAAYRADRRVWVILMDFKTTLQEDTKGGGCQGEKKGQSQWRRKWRNLQDMEEESHEEKIRAVGPPLPDGSSSWLGRLQEDGDGGLCLIQWSLGLVLRHHWGFWGKKKHLLNMLQSFYFSQKDQKRGKQVPVPQQKVH